MILAATGLRREARAIARDGVTVVACGGHGEVLAARLGAAIALRRPAGLLSIGLAGGLDPGLAVGAVVVGTGVGGQDCDGEWVGRLLAANPGAVAGAVAGVAAPAATRTAKAVLHGGGAVAVDMESQVVAAVAAAHGLAFAILRVIGDAAGDELPAAARVPLSPDGEVRMAAVLAAVARRPWQIPALIRLAEATGVALDRLRGLRIEGASRSTR